MNDFSIQFYARARDLAGSATASLALEEGTNVSALKQALLKRYPALATIEQHLLIAVNDEYVSGDRILQAGDRVSCFPPVSGG